MKSAFFHDGPTYTIDQKYYACVLNDELIDRYFYFSSELQIVNRFREISKTNNQEKFELITHGNTKFIEIPNLASIKGLILKSSESLRIIKSVVKNSDIVIVRLPSIAGGYAIHYANKFSKPYFVEVVGCTWDALSNYGIRGKLLAPVMFFWMRNLILKAPYVIYVTNEFLQKRYPNQGISIGISDVSIPETESSILNNRKNKIVNRKGPLVLGTVAGVDLKYKGQKHVIKAIAHLISLGYEIEYRLIGGGNNTSLFQLAERLNIAHNIKFLGPIPHTDIFKEFDEIDIYVQPSETEGMPRALIEAMSRGCPCIGSRVGGIPELIDKDFLFSKGNVDELINKILALKSDVMLVQSARNFYKAQSFNLRILTSNRNEFYKKILDNF